MGKLNEICNNFWYIVQLKVLADSGGHINVARIYEHTSLCLGSSGDHCIRLRLQQGELLHFEGQDSDAVATPGFSQ